MNCDHCGNKFKPGDRVIQAMLADNVVDSGGDLEELAVIDQKLYHPPCALVVGLTEIEE